MSREVEHGTRECWLLGCERYECVIAADIDPVVVERALNREVDRHRLTGDEQIEIARHSGQRRSKPWPAQVRIGSAG